jgi:hypothetical protein
MQETNGNRPDPRLGQFGDLAADLVWIERTQHHAVADAREAPLICSSSDARKSMQAGPRSEEVGFAHDSALEGTGFEPPVPRLG